MATDIVFLGGDSVKVSADLEVVAQALENGGSTVKTNRFAGFRGDEEVAGEPLIVNVAAIAYAHAVTAP
ncbi:MAG: hypothetical protein ACLP50_38425 [Solirubrobacteraceae bacterium]